MGHAATPRPRRWPTTSRRSCKVTRSPPDRPGRSNGPGSGPPAARPSIGTSYRKLGKFEPAARHLTAGLDLRRQHLGDTHRDTLAAASDRGLLLADQRKWDEAVPLLRQVAGDAGGRFGADDPLT